jgi:signal transduction histidine kinase
MIITEAKRADIPPSVSAYAQRAQRGVERLMRMIANLLDATRLDQGLFAITPEVVDLAQLARETADSLSTSANPVKVCAAEALVIEADSSRVREIIENLVGNAQRHSPEAVPVIVESGCEHRTNGSWAVLRVRDEGPGIAPEFVPQLFTRFCAGGTRGTLGLGLYLARGIAEAHGGTLSVEPAAGKGACFRLELPMPKGCP